MTSVLINDDEILFRQIHPDFFDKGEPSSNRFIPSSADQGKLSVDRGSLVSAQASHAAYVASGRLSAAVFGLTVGEFRSESISCFEDPIAASPGVSANPAHALADYSVHSYSQQKLVAKRLKRLAIARGQLHP